MAVEFMRRVVAKVVAELAGELLGEVPYIGWILGPAVECGIKEANGLPC